MVFDAGDEIKYLSSRARKTAKRSPLGDLPGLLHRTRRRSVHLRATLI
jgi:hypothetical protein